MKQITVFLLATLFMVSCTEKPGTDELSLIKVEKDSLKEVKATISERLAEIELRIAELDTTKSLALISTAAANIESFNHYFQVYGSLASDQNAQIYPEIGATITTIKVKEGQEVSKGQTIVTLDIQSIREQEAELKTRMVLAETTFQKQKKLWDQKIGSEIQFLQAKTNYNAQLKAVAQMRSQLAKTVIRAPFTGTIDDVITEKGSVLAPGTPLMRIVSLNNMYLEAEVPEKNIGSVKKGSDVIVKFPVLNESMNTKISQVSNYINPENRSFNIQIAVPNKNGKINRNNSNK